MRSQEVPRAVYQPASNSGTYVTRHRRLSTTTPPSPLHHHAVMALVCHRHNTASSSNLCHFAGGWQCQLGAHSSRPDIWERPPASSKKQSGFGNFRGETRFEFVLFRITARAHSCFGPRTCHIRRRRPARFPMATCQQIESQ